jgi:hypothetical protein
MLKGKTRDFTRPTVSKTKEKRDVETPLLVTVLTIKPYPMKNCNDRP